MRNIERVSSPDRQRSAAAVLPAMIDERTRDVAPPMQDPSSNPAVCTGEDRERIESWVNEGGGSDDVAVKGPLRFLLVEDDAMIGAMLTEMLADLGHEIGVVQATEDEAVAAAARHKPDLMIVDLQLTRGSGVAAVARITRAGPIPHIFMTGRGPLAARPGAVMLTKPFRKADLVRAIAQALNQDRVGVAE